MSCGTGRYSRSSCQRDRRQRADHPAMAEPSAEEIRALCAIFLPAFNRCHAGSFKLSEIPIASFADFIIRDNETEIPVQHVRAMESPRDDIVKPELAGRFMERLEGELKARGVSGIFVSMSLRGLSRDEGDLACLLADFIASQVGNVPAQFRLDV